MTESTTHVPNRSPAEYADEIGQVWTRILQRQFGEHQAVIKRAQYNLFFGPKEYTYYSVPEVIGQYVDEGDDYVLKPDYPSTLRKTFKFGLMDKFLGWPDLEKDGLQLCLNQPVLETVYEKSDTTQDHPQYVGVSDIVLSAKANQENLDRLLALEKHLIEREAKVAGDRGRPSTSPTEGRAR